MGALPKRKISRGRKGRRRAAIKLKVTNLIACPNCGQLRQSHRACPSCGYYKEREVVKIRVKKGKKKKE